MTELRIDPDTASREELVAEVNRLNEVCGRWSSSWKQIVAANAEAWQDGIEWRDQMIGQLNEIIVNRIEKEDREQELNSGRQDPGAGAPR